MKRSFSYYGVKAWNYQQPKLKKLGNYDTEFKANLKDSFQEILICSLICMLYIATVYFTTKFCTIKRPYEKQSYNYTSLYILFFILDVLKRLISHLITFTIITIIIKLGKAVRTCYKLRNFTDY